MKYIKRLLIIVLVIGAGAAVCMFYSPRHVMGEAAQALEVYYNVKKADAINSGQICVERDGETLNLTGSQRPYMTESMSLMIPITQVPRIFYSSVDVDRDKNLCFEANGHEVRISPETDGAVVDNKDTAFAEPMIWRNGRLYVSAALLAEAFGGSYSWDETTQTAVVTNAQSVPETLPKAYDMRDDERVTPVRDQGNLGTCWAFASLGALESSLMPGESYMFSPDHMSFMSGYNMTQQDGGDFNMALAYLTSWKGPVLENEDPYGDGATDSSLTASVHLQEAVSIPAKDFDGIKAAIHQWGGVQSSFYSDMEFANSSSSYYSAKDCSYYYPGKNTANHDIVIVGWDDDYPKENFNVHPENDGAFLCRNSWGSQFGDRGYFYISYEDTNIGTDNLVYTRVETTDNYDCIYQSDLLGWVGTIGYSEEGAWFSNVYEAQKDEMIKAAAFYTTGPSSYFDIFIVRDFTDSQSFDTMEYVKSGYIENAGYHTVDFLADLPVNAGDKFAVIVHLVTEDSLRPVAIEYETGEWTSSVDISDGEGYLSYDGRTWENIESVYESNACLKVFTDRRESE